MKNKYNIPNINFDDTLEFFFIAKNSKNLRYPKILHKKGDVFNSVFNFILKDSYMQPHLHPGAEKIEYIHLIRGKLAVLFFDISGNITSVHFMNEGNFIKIPSFTFHTYVMMSKYVLTYETMMGIYDKSTWKQFPDWAPPEDSDASIKYFLFLNNYINAV